MTNKAMLAILPIAIAMLTACTAQPSYPVASVAPAGRPGPASPAPLVIEPARPVRSGTMVLPGPY